MKHALKLLIGGTGAFWLVVSYPAYRLGGEVSLVTAALAALLCLLPTTASLIWAGWARDQSPERQLLMMVGGTGLRMVAVLGAGLLLSPCYPAVVVAGLRQLRGLWSDVGWMPAQETTPITWWGWLLVFYLFTLALEVGIVVAARVPRIV